MIMLKPHLVILFNPIRGIVLCYADHITFLNFRPLNFPESLTSTSRILTPSFHNVQSMKQPKAPNSMKTPISRTTTPKTTTAKLLRPRALKNNKNILEVHLPTLISSFISENDIQPNLKSQIISAMQQSEKELNDQRKPSEEEAENSQAGIKFYKSVHLLFSHI